MDNTKVTQTEMVLAYLRQHPEGITPMDALKTLGCFRLAARIFELREHGVQIEDETIEVGPEKKKVSRYRLVTRVTIDRVPKPDRWECTSCHAITTTIDQVFLGGYGRGGCPSRSCPSHQRKDPTVTFAPFKEEPAHG